MAEHVEDLLELSLDDFEPKQVILVGSMLTANHWERLLDLLTGHKDVFTWTHDDMSVIDPEVMVRKLNVRLVVRPVRQKRRSFIADRNSTISKEVDKLKKVWFIQEINYPEWLSNVVLFKRSNEKWRMFIDFINLNKPCSKDSFPLP